MNKIKNAKIDSTTLGFEGHGILSSSIYLGYEEESASQALGGYDLRTWLCSFWVRRTLETLGVDSWEKVKGQYVRVEVDSDGRVCAFGHITKGKWFRFKEEIEAEQQKRKGVDK